MHPNKAFRRATLKENLEFAAERGFGVLTVSGPDGPLVSHVPFVMSGDAATFGAHLVKSNPILKLVDEPQSALMVVSGPDSYVSPDWYGVDDQVPTWNYVAVHLRGKLQRLAGDQLRPHLRSLSGVFEQRLAPKASWTLDKVSPDALERLESMIVPVQFTIESIDGTWKLNQNKPPPARLGAAEGIASAGLGMMAGELALLMRQVEDPD